MLVCASGTATAFELFGTDFEEKIEAVSAFCFEIGIVLATLQNLRKISNDLDRATYINDGDWKLDHVKGDDRIKKKIVKFPRATF